MSETKSYPDEADRGDLDDDTKREFLHELALLTRKHGIVVVGCGCCQSPCLAPLLASDASPHNTYHDRNFDVRNSAEVEWGPREDPNT